MGNEEQMVDKKVRVLIAEDSTGEAASALRLLYPEEQGRLELTDVGSLSTLLPTLAMVNPDVILLDLELTRPDPVEGVRRVHRSAPEMPLIILAHATEKDDAKRCLEAGATDYLLKGFMD